jgi:lipid II:glycine glycyltransferase (peptidoglycan interpeptide bridge formation enzyme)
LIANFKSKTRYNYRLAQKKGVICRFVGLEAFPDFMRLMEQTATRDRFAAHSEIYYRTMLESLRGGEATARLAIAYFEDRPIAANIIVDFAGVRTYLHGATSNLHRDVMAQYALHVFLMTDAIANHLHTFDFWGIAPAEAPVNHPWSGITRYKLGFGGTSYSMPGTIDLPLRHAWYGLYRFVKNLRRAHH